MEQLTTLDSGFLHAEDADRHISLAIGAVAVLTGPMPDFDLLAAGLAERILSTPRFRQVLCPQPLDISAPKWVDDANFDVSHHIRRGALTRPGDDTALREWVAEVMERRLDRDRPLWECWVVDGLAHHRWAILIKVHHCLADGVAATDLLTRLCDDSPAGTYAIRPVRKAAPAKPMVTPNPVNWIGGAWRTSRSVTTELTHALRGAAEIAGGLLQARPASSLTGPVTTLRRYASAEVSLDDVTAICDRFDVTINDVALAAITDAYRTILLGRGEPIRRDSLRTLVPVSMRTTDGGDQIGNRVSVMLPCLPVDQDDPIAQLRAVHDRLTRTKSSGQRQAGSLLMSAASAIPFPFTAWLIRTLTRLPQRGVVTLATNVPGPRKRVRVLGREVVRLLPIPPLAMQLRTGVAILSYADHLTFGIIGDYDAAPDIDALASGIEAAIARLTTLSAGYWRSTPMGTLALVQGG